METEWGFPIESEKERGFSIFKSEEEITREMKKRFQEFIALRQKDVQSKISVQCDNVTIEKITDLLLDIRFMFFDYQLGRFIGMIPKEILKWIEYGRKNFGWDKGVMAGLDSLEYGVYYHVLPAPQFSKAVEDSIREQRPTNIDERNRNALTELRKYKISEGRLKTPIGKGIGRTKHKKGYDPIKRVLKTALDNVPGKHWPIVTRTIVHIYSLLRPLYPQPREKRNAHSGLYRSRLLQDIRNLMKTDFLEDLTERDVISAIEYHFTKKRRRIS